MTNSIYSTYNNKVYRKLTLMLFISLISIARISSLTIEVQENNLRVPENSDVNLTCLITEEQETGSGELITEWSVGRGEKITEGVETTWNVTSRIGQTLLRIPNVSKEKGGTYVCWVMTENGGGAYKTINVEVINNTQESDMKVVNSTQKDFSVEVSEIGNCCIHDKCGFNLKEKENIIEELMVLVCKSKDKCDRDINKLKSELEDIKTELKELQELLIKYTDYISKRQRS